MGGGCRSVVASCIIISCLGVWGEENLGSLGLWKMDVEGVVIKSSPGEAAVSGERYSDHDVV